MLQRQKCTMERSKIGWGCFSREAAQRQADRRTADTSDDGGRHGLAASRAGAPLAGGRGALPGLTDLTPLCVEENLYQNIKEEE